MRTKTDYQEQTDDKGKPVADLVAKVSDPAGVVRALLDRDDR